MAHDSGEDGHLIRPRSDQSRSWAIWTRVGGTPNAQWSGARLATLYCLVGGTLPTSSFHSACWQRYCCRQFSFLLCHAVPRRIQFASTFACLLDKRTMVLFFLSALHTGVACSLNSNTVEPATSGTCVNYLGSSCRFFRMVSIRSKLRLCGSHNSSKDVKKLSVTTVCLASIAVQ